MSEETPDELPEKAGAQENEPQPTTYLFSWNELKALFNLVCSGLQQKDKATPYNLYHLHELETMDEEARESWEEDILDFNTKANVIGRGELDLRGEKRALEQLGDERHSYRFSPELEKLCKRYFPLARGIGVATRHIVRLYDEFGLTPSEPDV